MSKELFRRYSKNPIIDISDLPYPANAVFNAGATLFNGETLLLMRVEDKRGISHLLLGRSKDGVRNWVIDKEPTLLPEPDFHPEEEFGIEDPRITYLDEIRKWAIVYTAYSKYGPLVSLALTEDFRSFDKKGVILPPENKDAAIFPERFSDKWALIHRPSPKDLRAGAHIWISFGYDLCHWGEHRILFESRDGAWWDSGRIGLSTPPLKTDKGWLLLYHGVKLTVSGAIYRLGLALLDLKDPRNVIFRSEEWVFGPEKSYELIGDVDKVVFPCGWVRVGDEIRLYYGSADKCIGLATANVNDVLEWIEKHSKEKSR